MSNFHKECVGDVELGKCDICGNIDVLRREYFHYNIKCECHSPDHFEIVCHCKNCVPVEPEKAKLTISTKLLKKLK